MIPCPMNGVVLQEGPGLALRIDFGRTFGLNAKQNSLSDKHCDEAYLDAAMIKRKNSRVACKKGVTESGLMFWGS